MVRRPRTIDLDLASRLTRGRVERKLTQNQLALLTGISEGAISKYETARCPVPGDRLAIILAILDAAEEKLAGWNA